MDVMKCGVVKDFLFGFFCLAVMASLGRAEPNSIPYQPHEEMIYGGFALDSYVSPFDSEDQDFTVLVYEAGGIEPSIEEAMKALGIMLYDLRGPGNPVTAGDLATHDLLIVGWNNRDDQGDTSGLDPNIIENGIPGRCVLSGHDLDFHTIDGGYEEAAAMQCLAQAILFVLDGEGTGLIALGDTNQPPFGYLPSSWGVTPERKNGGIGGEYISDFTQRGEASGIFDGLEPEDMCEWGMSYHDVFTKWGEEFAPLEIGEWEWEVVTIARAPELTVILTNTDNRSSPCINRGETITYSLVWYYPEGQNHSDLEDVILVDHLAPGTEYVSSESSVEDQGQYNPTTGTITWNIGTLSPGAAGAALVNVTVNGTASSGEMLHNTATLFGPGILRVEAEEVTRVCCDGGEIIYVKWDAEGDNNGSSWENAFTDLKTALEHAASACQKNVWVAQGIYKPGPLPTDSFIVPDGVKIYGGLLGYEGPSFDLGQRNLSVVKAILSGHVSEYVRNEKVIMMGNNTMLSGCVVEDAGENYGGIYGENADFTVERCTVKGNRWHGIYCKDGSLTVNWCEVTDNGFNGILIDAINGLRKSLTILNSIILRNASYDSSGFHGIYGKGLWDATIKNSVINANGPEYAYVDWTDYSGIKLENVANPAEVHNCTIVGNKGMGIVQEGCALPDVRNCILWENNMATDGCQRAIGMGVSYSCVMNLSMPDPNGCINTNPLFTYNDPNFAWHLLSDSPCMDAGDPGSNVAWGPTDIDGGDRVILPHVDIGADEVTCEDVWNPFDWDRDGDIDLIEFARFANAWRGRDPQGPPADPNLHARWDATANLVADYVIDMNDLRIFCDGDNGYQGYFWMACWKALPYPWPVMQTTLPIEPNDPNAPWDPNEPQWDPNDPNFPGFGMMSMESQAAFGSGPVGESGLSIAEFEEMIAFLNNDVLGESALTQEEADNILGFLQVLQQELDLLYEIQWFGPESAW